MSDEFEKTVDLKERMAAKRKRGSNPKLKQTEEIDRVYSREDRSEIQKINRPVERKVNEPLFKRVVILVALMVVTAIIYFSFLKHDGNQSGLNNDDNWYAMKLVNNEIYYGQVEDTTTDPIVIRNVYYNYDQDKEEVKDPTQAGNLRLVKRGKETHGPEGTMDIIRSQILYLEPLKADSKVLKAILDYEK